MKTFLKNATNGRAEERDLLLQCIAGDQQASEAFVKAYSNLVYHAIQYTLLSKNIGFDSQDAEDLHNTVFLKLFEKNCLKLRQFKGRNGCSVSTWIRLIAVRTVLNFIRQSGVDSISGQRLRVSIEEIAELKDRIPETWTMMEKKEQLNLLRQGLNHLSPRDRLFMKLYLEKGYSIKEISETMQISIDNVYMVKHRSVKRLKTYLESKILA
jgi:RNA polymerase sigma factor (sigma-70 family)